VVVVAATVAVVEVLISETNHVSREYRALQLFCIYNLGCM